MQVKTTLRVVMIVMLLSFFSTTSFAVPFHISGGPEFGIDTDPATTVALTSPLAGTIQDLNVHLFLDSYFEDLEVSLVHNGTSVLLSSGQGGSGPIDLTFDDDAIIPLLFDVSGTFAPLDLLDAFTGMDLSGVWELQFLDIFYPEDGDFLIGWSIFGEYEPATGPEPVPEPSTVVLLGCALLGLAWYNRRRVKS